MEITQNHIGAPQKGSAKKIVTPGAWLTIGVLFLILFPALWAFQIVRSLHYEIIREKVSLDCSDCGQRETGKLRAFVGYPQTGMSVKPESGSPIETKNITAKTWCSDLNGQGQKSSEVHADYHFKIGEKEFSGTCGTIPKGIANERFIYFLFLPKLKSDVAWANQNITPNFVLFNWADMSGYILQSFSISGLLSSFFLAAFLVFGLRYLILYRKEVFNLRFTSRPDQKFYVKYAAITACIIVAYMLPLFHNSVLLFYSLFVLAAFAFHRLFLSPQKSLASPAQPPKASLVTILAVALLMVIGFGMRAYKADWGFPLLLHTDEYAITTFPAEMAVHNSIDPIDYERPNHTSIYLNSIMYGILSHAKFHQPLQNSFPDHQTFYYYFSRILVALMGVLSIWVAFLIGAEFHTRFGFFAALLYTLFPQFIEHSHYITPDISLTVLLQGVILFSIRYIKNPSAAPLLYACACAAFASSEKYPGILSLIAVAAALLVVHYRDRRRLLLMSARVGVGYAVFLFFAAPYLYFKPHLVLLNLISESRPTHPGQDGLSFFGNLMYYIHTYGLATSALMSACCMIGFVILAVKYPRTWVPLLLGLVYWIILSQLPLHWERWDLPMVISPLLFTAFGMHVLWEYGKNMQGAFKVLSLALLSVIFITISVNQTLKCWVEIEDFKSTDTRLQGKSILSEKGLTETNTLVGHYTPLSPTWKRGFDFISSYHDSETMEGKKFAVVSSDLYGRYYKEPEKYPNEIAFYNKLFTLPSVVNIIANPMPNRFESFFEFKNISEAIPSLKFYLQSHPHYSKGPEIRAFSLISLDSLTQEKVYE